LTKIHADQAWAKTKGAGITIAIIDTGIDLGHPDLKSKIASHYNCIGGSCVGGSGAGNDDNGHGSHVSGIAAASTLNGIGVAGVAPAAKLMALKVLDSSGKGQCSDIPPAIRFASDHGARVINLSLGTGTSLLGFLFGNSCLSDLQSAAEYAYGRGAVVVIAAGNDDIKSVYDSPALEVVGATGPQDEKAKYSNTGASVYAPGGDSSDCSTDSTPCILSTYMNHEYAFMQGTSQATPFVSGLAALLLSEGYSNAQAVARINSTADSVNGLRRINVARAVGASTKPSSSPAPTPTHSVRHSTTPTPSATTSQTKPVSVPVKPSPTRSTNVLAVGPTLSPSPTLHAEGPPVGTTSEDRAVPIAAAAIILGLVAGLTLRFVARRA
jgi:subtilisin family serine protease